MIDDRGTLASDVNVQNRVRDVLNAHERGAATGDRERERKTVDRALEREEFSLRTILIVMSREHVCDFPQSSHAPFCRI